MQSLPRNSFVSKIDGEGRPRSAFHFAQTSILTSYSSACGLSGNRGVKHCADFAAAPRRCGSLASAHQDRKAGLHASHDYRAGCPELQVRDHARTASSLLQRSRRRSCCLPSGGRKCTPRARNSESVPARPDLCPGRERRTGAAMARQLSRRVCRHKSWHESNRSRIGPDRQSSSACACC
jgi:hypothetical protein